VAARHPDPVTAASQLDETPFVPVHAPYVMSRQSGPSDNVLMRRGHEAPREGRLRRLVMRHTHIRSGKPAPTEAFSCIPPPRA
jgi:hypothetical protein